MINKLCRIVMLISITAVVLMSIAFIVGGVACFFDGSSAGIILLGVLLVFSGISFGSIGFLELVDTCRRPF